MNDENRNTRKNGRLPMIISKPTKKSPDHFAFNTEKRGPNVFFTGIPRDGVNPGEVSRRQDFPRGPGIQKPSVIRAPFRGNHFGLPSQRVLANRDGLTLLEVLITIFVLAVGIIPAFQVFSRGSVGTLVNRDELLAHQYANELIDFALATGFDHLDPELLKRQPMRQVEGGSPIDQRFKRFFTVQLKIPAQGIADWPIAYKILTAEIEWDSGGVSKYFVLTSLVFQGRRQ